MARGREQALHLMIMIIAVLWKLCPPPARSTIPRKRPVSTGLRRLADPIRLKRFHCVFVESGDEDNQR